MLIFPTIGVWTMRKPPFVEQSLIGQKVIITVWILDYCLIRLLQR